ncbi:HAD family hydrolase [Streptococcus infantis]|uniref:HAD family hydrolase n=1 Tax=Streptococcus infantis TaxID=68892 RepID=UPI0039C45243
MSRIKLIMSDIDGTILDKNHQLDSYLIELMPLLKQRDIPFVLASARSPLGIAPISKELGITDFPIACYNGALISLGDKILSQHSIDKSELLLLHDFLKKEFPTVSINVYSGKDWLVNTIDEWVEIEATITGESPKVTSLADFIRDEKTLVHKLLLIDNTDTIQKLQKNLSSIDFPQTDFYLSKDNYLEVTHNQVSKKQALLELAKYYQLSLNEIMTIGDNYNDIPMIETAGLGIAMGNAPRDVKTCAKAVTDSNEQNGVSKAIKLYVLSESSQLNI